MQIISLDFETYYAKDYSLRRLTYEQYIRDERFQVIGLAGVRHIHGDTTTPEFIAPDKIPQYLGEIDWANTAVLCHNAAFDGSILNWVYGVSPALYLDTLSMARPFNASTTGCSLARLAKAYGIGTKGNEVHDMMGKRLEDFTPREYEAYGKYAVNDAELTIKIYDKLKTRFNVTEILAIDQFIRMAVEPIFELDKPLLEKHLTTVRVAKKLLMSNLGGSEEEVRKMVGSAAKFAAALKAEGVEPPTKISPTTGKTTFAFAKTDLDFLALSEHPNERVQALVAARLGAKSTIEETRTESLIAVADRGRLPILLNYWGAHTGRGSGGGGLNPQNLPSRGGKNTIRRALKAPAGHKIVVCDSSQIEARMTAWLAGQRNLLEGFRDGRDVYCEFASDAFHRPVTKAEKMERFVGKTCILGLGYGMGWERLSHTLNTQGGISLTPTEAERIVRLYRNKYHRIQALWSSAAWALSKLKAGQRGPWLHDSILTLGDKEIILPNGMPIRYAGLTTLEHNNNQFFYINNPRNARQIVAATMRGETPDEKYYTKIYGGKVIENVVQALAALYIRECMAKIGQRYKIALQVHDEIVLVVPEDEAEEAKQALMKVMSTPPDWAPDLPVACEADIADNYGDCK